MSPPAPASVPELKRVLVVDDEQVVLAALRETLRLEGYEVFGVEDPIEALRLLRSHAFSVILTDQQMPGLTGLEFLAQAKEVQPNATRILITAVLSLGTVIDSINKGEVYRFIVKPWLREELLVTIRNAALRYELICRNAALHAESVALNDQLASQLEQLETLNQTLHKNLDRSILLCLKTMETFFPLLGRQARRVFGLCQAMGHDLGLSREDRRILEISSRLYDIGLVGSPRELIRKWQHTPDMLGDEERAIIQLHPALGQDLACFGADLEAVGTVIRAHHERFDGQGYPDGLDGERIPWLARLLAAAVAFATYPSSEEAALERVKADSGSAFDPDAVRALLRSLPQTVILSRQREVLLAELLPGMVVAQGIHTAYGLLLVPEGQALTESHIQLLRNHNQITPITQNLLVYC